MSGSDGKIRIVGAGFVSAAGHTSRVVAETLRSGKNTWVRDGKTGLPIYPASVPEASDSLAAFLQRRRPGRAATLALHAAERACPPAWRGRDVATLIGCSRGPTAAWEERFGEFAAGGELPPSTSPRTTLGSLAFAVADYLNLPGLTTGMSVTCSSGLHALLHGVALLESGLAERVLAGGAEAPLTVFTLAQMRALRVYAEVPGATQPACRPFADPPSGMALGEGAGLLALERGPGPGPYLLGIGFARETGRGATGMSPEGLGFQASMRMAIARAGVVPDAVVAHAPGTALGDGAERAAIRTVLGDGVAVTTGKWATGHTFGASGPLGIEVGLALLRGGGEAWARYPVAIPPRRVLVNAAGFGGNFISVLIGS